jgi:hypothetical protein
MADLPRSLNRRNRCKKKGRNQSGISKEKDKMIHTQQILRLLTRNHGLQSLLG